MDNVGRNIARIRLFKMIGQKEMAGYLKISQQEYSRLERKKVLPAVLVTAIAKKLECPAEIILHLDQMEYINQILHQSRNNEKVELKKVEEVFERLLKEKDEVIRLLHLQINNVR